MKTANMVFTVTTVPPSSDAITNIHGRLLLQVMIMLLRALISELRQVQIFQLRQMLLKVPLMFQFLETVIQKDLKHLQLPCQVLLEHQYWSLKPRVPL